MIFWRKKISYIFSIYLATTRKTTSRSVKLYKVIKKAQFYNNVFLEKLLRL